MLCCVAFPLGGASEVRPPFFPGQAGAQQHAVGITSSASQQIPLSQPSPIASLAQSTAGIPPNGIPQGIPTSAGQVPSSMPNQTPGAVVSQLTAPPMGMQHPGKPQQMGGVMPQGGGAGAMPHPPGQPSMQGIGLQGLPGQQMTHVRIQGGQPGKGQQIQIMPGQQGVPGMPRPPGPGPAPGAPGMPGPGAAAQHVIHGQGAPLHAGGPSPHVTVRFLHGAPPGAQPMQTQAGQAPGQHQGVPAGTPGQPQASVPGQTPGMPVPPPQPVSRPPAEGTASLPPGFPTPNQPTRQQGISYQLINIQKSLTFCLQVLCIERVLNFKGGK